jgi:histone-lysine N-methyltransferase ASH1L
MSITPDREVSGITGAITSKIAGVSCGGEEGSAETGAGSAQAETDTDAGTEAATATDDDVGEVKEEEEGAGHEAGHAQKASEQTRATRKSWYRTLIPESPTTYHTKEGRAIAPAPISAVRRSLRSSDKSAASGSSENNGKGARGAGHMTRRQSKRLMAATKLAASTTPAPTRGKRSHEAMAAGSKSANAKLQNSTPATAGHSGNGQPPLRFSKRTKKILSYSEDDHDEQFVLSLARGASEITSKSQGRKRKNWLNQGLYLGQEQDIDVTKRPVGGLTRTRGGQTAEQARRPILPLPMFTGLRIMNTERDFKLPFNIYAPSPWKCGPIQDWRKLNHSTSSLPLFSPICFCFFPFLKNL